MVLIEYIYWYNLFANKWKEMHKIQIISGYSRIVASPDFVLVQCARVASPLKYVGPNIPFDSTGGSIQ